MHDVVVDLYGSPCPRCEGVLDFMGKHGKHDLTCNNRMQCGFHDKSRWIIPLRYVGWNAIGIVGWKPVHGRINLLYDDQATFEPSVDTLNLGSGFVFGGYAPRPDSMPSLTAVFPLWLRVER